MQTSPGPDVTWRLLRDGARPGASNMAIDESMMRAEETPTVRFYGWEPWCVSLGVQQRLADVDLARAGARGLDVVRRPTGGRGIVHGPEVTYSVVAPIDDPHVAGALLESYRRISAGLLAGLERLGIRASAERAGRDPVGRRQQNCFVAISHYEVTVDGRKLIGSAQTRSPRWLLQHGTLLLEYDAALWERVFPGGGRTRESVASLDQLLQPLPSRAQVEDALAAGLESALGIQLEAGPLSGRELAIARQVEEERYASQAWLARRP